jgi:hypothetical protein
MPYRSMDDRIDGVVITLADITAAKMLEAKLLAQQAEWERQFARTTPLKSLPRKTRTRRS